MKNKTATMMVVVMVAVMAMAVVTVAATMEEGKVGIGIKQRAKECTRKAKTGDKLKMHYTGTLAKDGSKFDSSLDRNEPFEFTLGVGQVIRGWDQGIQGMCVGEKRKLRIPSDLGYGPRGAGDKIPPNSDLIFDIELLEIVDKKEL